MRFLQQLTGITPILVYLEPIFHMTAISLVCHRKYIYIFIAMKKKLKAHLHTKKSFKKSCHSGTEI